MSENIHRDNANAARATAAASNLPNVRARHLRSAEASDALADMQERAAAQSRARLSEAALRKADRVTEESARAE